MRGFNSAGYNNLKKCLFNYWINNSDYYNKGNSMKKVTFTVAAAAFVLSTQMIAVNDAEAFWSPWNNNNGYNNGYNNNSGPWNWGGNNNNWSGGNNGPWNWGGGNSGPWNWGGNNNNWGGGNNNWSSGPWNWGGGNNNWGGGNNSFGPMGWNNGPTWDGGNNWRGNNGPAFNWGDGRPPGAMQAPVNPAPETAPAITE